MNNLLRKRTSPTAERIDKVVPPPKDRVNLIRAIHIEVGHFGVHKAFSLLETTYFGVVCLCKSARKFRLARYVIA
jgi:hypothetical protein